MNSTDRSRPIAESDLIAMGWLPSDGANYPLRCGILHCNNPQMTGWTVVSECLNGDINVFWLPWKKPTLGQVLDLVSALGLKPGDVT